MMILVAHKVQCKKCGHIWLHPAGTKRTPKCSKCAQAKRKGRVSHGRQ
jgi:hypothetical protein